MAGLDDLMKGLGAFNDGVRQLATTNAINDAHQQITDINSQQMNDLAKRQAAEQVAKDMSLRMINAGAHETTVQRAFDSLAPKQFKSPDEAILQGKMQGSDDIVNAGVEAQKLMPDFQLKQEQIKGAIEARKLMAQQRSGIATEKQDKAYTDLQESFRKDKNNSSLISAVQEADKIKDHLIPDKNGRIDPSQIMLSAVGVIKAAGLSRITELELEKGAANPSMRSNIMRKLGVSMNNSALKDDVKYYTFLGSALKAQAQKHLSDKIDRFSKGAEIGNPAFKSTRVKAALMNEHLGDYGTTPVDAAPVPEATETPAGPSQINWDDFKVGP